MGTGTSHDLSLDPIILGTLMKRTASAILSIILAASALSAEPSLDDCLYKDEAAAAKAWKPMSGSASPRPGTAAGRDALLLPCNFAGTKIERASWDREIKFSLAGHQGISFEIWCRDSSPISSMVIYLQSGKGWYTAHFPLPQAGQWGRIKIDREDMNIEGAPGGWNQIQTIRLSAWRGGDVDTLLAIRDLRRMEDTASIYIVRNESALARNPEDEPSIHNYPRDIAGHLRKLGLPYTLVSDLDMPNRDMSRAKLVILPYTHQLSPEALAALEKYVAGGGKNHCLFHSPRRRGQADRHSTGSVQASQASGSVLPDQGRGRCAQGHARCGTAAFLEYRVGQTHRRARSPSPRRCLVGR